MELFLIICTAHCQRQPTLSAETIKCLVVINYHCLETNVFRDRNLVLDSSTALFIGLPIFLMLKKPKGYRKIVVGGKTWYWVPSVFPPLIIREASTGKRFEVSWADLDQIYKTVPPGPWDEWRECTMILPSHVAHWVKDHLTWKTVK